MCYTLQTVNTAVNLHIKTKKPDQPGKTMNCHSNQDYQSIQNLGHSTV